MRENIITLIAIIVLVYIVWRVIHNIIQKKQQRKYDYDEVTSFILKGDFFKEAKVIMKKSKEYKYLLYIQIYNMHKLDVVYGQEHRNIILKDFSNNLRRCYGRETLISRIGENKFIALINESDMKENTKRLEYLSKGYENSIDEIYKLSLKMQIYDLEDVDYKIYDLKIEDYIAQI